MSKRNLIDVIKKIQSERFENIVSSDLSVDLLWAYSQLFMNGKQPNWCSRCMRNYYAEICKNGLEMADKLIEAQNRTCKPNWNGNKYIHRAGRHYSNIYINDKEAIDLINRKFINESDFDVLPEEYVKEPTPVGFIPEIKQTVIETVTPENIAPKQINKTKK